MLIIENLIHSNSKKKSVWFLKSVLDELQKFMISIIRICLISIVFSFYYENIVKIKDWN